MVLRSAILAAKRVPSIRFRCGANVATAGADSVATSAAATGAQVRTVRHWHPHKHTNNELKHCTSSPFTAYSQQSANRAPAIEDWQLPARYGRKALSQEEIDYINRGGPE